jgi:signal peptidase II
MKNSKYLIQLVCIALIAFILDQFTKEIVFGKLEKTKNEVIEIISNILHFERVTNTGGFWGIFHGKNTLIMITNLCVFPLLIVLFYKFIFLSALTRTGLALIIGGAVGNIWDRIFYGYVRDFVAIVIIRWPIFNLADVFISIGAILVIFYLLKEKQH